MQVNAGVVYDYFFIEHTQCFFSWLKLSAKGARHWGRLSEPALTVSKNISKVATFCQYGSDIPYAFQSFKKAYAGHSSKNPRWVETCRVVNHAAFIWGISKHDIFGRPCSILEETVEAVTDLIVSGYGLYKFMNKWHEAPKIGQVTHSWDAPKNLRLVHKVSNFVLDGLALFSLYKGVDEYAPNLTIFFTATGLSSHFLNYYNQAVKKQSPLLQ
jgi:hypothetical protein